MSDIGITEFDLNRGDYIEAFFDLSTCEADPNNPKKQNVLSLGQDIKIWSSNGKYNLHFYYPDDVESMMMRYSFTIGQKVPGKSYTKRLMGKAYVTDLANTIIRLDKDGLWIDGVLLSQENYINGDKYNNQPSQWSVYEEWMEYFRSHAFTDLEVGSKEGENRSYANYIEIKATQVIPNN